MSVNVNIMKHLDWVTPHSFTSANFENFFGHAFTKIREASQFIVNNQMAQTATVFTFNLLLLNLIDKVTEATTYNFKLEENDKLWYKAGKIGTKGLIVLGGLSVVNHLMQLQLTRLYVVSTVVAALVSQVLWQKYIRPAIDDYNRMDNENITPTQSDDLDILNEEEILFESDTENEGGKLIESQHPNYETVATQLGIFPSQSEELKTPESERAFSLDDSTFLSERVDIMKKFTTGIDLPSDNSDK